METWICLGGVVVIVVVFRVIASFFKIRPENHPVYEAAMNHEHKSLIIRRGWLSKVKGGGYPTTEAYCQKCGARFGPVRSDYWVNFRYYGRSYWEVLL